MNKPAAIYARVSSDRQKENHTIASQTAALIEYAQTHGYSVPAEGVFQDEGYSGAILVRPGLEALRDLAAEGQIAAALIYSPDRLLGYYGPLGLPPGSARLQPFGFIRTVGADSLVSGLPAGAVSDGRTALVFSVLRFCSSLSAIAWIAVLSFPPSDSLSGARWPRSMI